MRKHSAWQKDRNRVRRLNREVKAIIRRDDARAEWFNSRHAFMLEENRKLFLPSGCWYICPDHYTSQWPSVDGMFIEVTHGDFADSGNSDVPEGLYVVRRVSHCSQFDKLLDVTNVNTGRDELLWFPRIGHRVVSCGEVGETPWLD